MRDPSDAGDSPSVFRNTDGKIRGYIVTVVSGAAVLTSIPPKSTAERLGWGSENESGAGREGRNESEDLHTRNVCSSMHA